MDRFWASFNIDRLSFWIGFLAASIFWGFLVLLRPFFARIIAGLRTRSQNIRQEMMSGIDIRLNNDTLQLTQKLHLAVRLFALDEILITPRLLAPPPQVLPDENPIREDIISEMLPYAPDWPEMAVLYGAPTITLAQALQETSRLILLGRSGSGKTVALAQLATQIILKEKLPGDLNKRTPIWIPVGDLVLPAKNPENLLETLYDAITPYTSTLILPRLLSHLETLFHNHQALLLIDGLDELPPPSIDEIVEFIGELLREYPATPIVTTASLDYYGRMAEHDFAPVALASWDDNQRAEFIRKWSEHWEKYVGPLNLSPEGTDPLLLNAWLLQDHNTYSPLELTLKVWATYAGDTLGPKSIHSLEAYIRRMTVDIPNGREALERLSQAIIKTKQPIFTTQVAEEWLSGTTQNPVEYAVTTESDGEEDSIDASTPNTKVKLTSSRIVPHLQANGLVSKRRDGRLQIIHPQILSYLGGYPLSKDEQDFYFRDKPYWTSAVDALGYHAIKDNSESEITAFIQSESAPIYRSIFHAALWLRDSDTRTSWRVNIIRQLVNIIRDEKAPISLRIRSATALGTCGVQGIETLFQNLISAQDSQLRMLAALGSGLIGNPILADNLITLINDQALKVRQAASYALVAVGSQAALEAVVEVLLHSDEEMRRAAAEALANHREEGHPTLKEGATLDDILVRRAVTYGLRRIKQTWSTQLLEKMQIEDSEWAVNNVAAEALKDIQRPNHRLPRRFPPLTETPWLIGFAGERGIGVSPGKPARALIIQALQEGKPEQKLAALDYLLRYANEDDTLSISQIMDSNQPDIREAAFNAIWHLSLTGRNVSPSI